ncbi:MAG: rhodanese-like domain-containing protein [Halothiobacillaceae bacterium]
MPMTRMEVRRAGRRAGRSVVGAVNHAGMTMALVALLFFPMLSAAGAEEFPLRDKYAAIGIAAIETAELADSLASFTVVDARSSYEYETLHIKDAHSVPLALSAFNALVVSLADSTGRPLVFYCNGVTCAVSYKAALKAREAGVPDVRVYDAGIFAWAQAYPEQTVLLGEPLESADRLIADEEFEAHLLTENAFYARIAASAEPLIIDIRNREQRQGVSLFQMRDRHIPLSSDNHELEALVQAAIREERPILFFDATGKQVRWLQYYLKAQGAEDYWFLEGGARALYQSMGIN